VAVGLAQHRQPAAQAVVVGAEARAVVVGEPAAPHVLAVASAP
jgi:hypothetical protein